MKTVTKVSKNYNEMSYPELAKAYHEKTGDSFIGKSKKQLLEYLTTKYKTPQPSVPVVKEERKPRTFVFKSDADKERDQDDEKGEDVFVKQEGYGDFKFLTKKAKAVAHKLGIPNSYQEFGEKFCGRTVYYHNKPKTHLGVYSCGVKLSKIESITKQLRKQGLTVVSEFDM